MKYLCFIFLIAGFSIACTGSGNRNSRTTPSGPIAVVIDTITDATDSDRIAPGTLTDLRNPAYMRAVADTIRLQLGGALYDAADPADSITVLETYYDQDSVYGLSRTYVYINHNRETPAYRWFEPDSLQKRFDSYREDMIRDGSAALFDEALQRGRDTLIIRLDSTIERYRGYWVCVYKYPGREDYYLDDNRTWKFVYCLSDSTFSFLNMDGPEPDLITSFQSDSAGNFTIGFPGREADFSLIDPERGLYRETIKGKFRSYMIPASNVRKFDIIRYADTDGGMISWFERVEEE